MDNPPKARRVRANLQLVSHDIHLHCDEARGASNKVTAFVRCERSNCMVDVEACAYCEHFARIDVHEAGYTLLCRSQEPDNE